MNLAVLYTVRGNFFALANHSAKPIKTPPAFDYNAFLYLKGF